MIDETKLLRIFEITYGEMSSDHYAEVLYDAEGHVTGVACMTDGGECWSQSLAEITFSYVAWHLLGMEDL